MINLDKKVIIITGGTNGIGFETTKLLSKNNSIVYVLDIDKRKSTYFKKNNIHFKVCDVSDINQVRNAIEEIMKHEKKIDVLINNAAQQIISDYSNYTEENYLKIMKVNYIGTCNCIAETIKYMRKKATILNILSIHSSKPRMNKYAYDSSKSAVESLTKELALEFAEKGITINALSFGAVDTDMNALWKTNKIEKEKSLEKVPLKIIFKPNNIAHFIKIILESFSEYTTGSVFVIDGGRSLK